MERNRSVRDTCTFGCEMFIFEPWKTVTGQCVPKLFFFVMLQELGSVICNFSVWTVSSELYALLCVTGLTVGQLALLIFVDRE
jgi:hypothetical protein